MTRQVRIASAVVVYLFLLGLMYVDPPDTLPAWASSWLMWRLSFGAYLAPLLAAAWYWWLTHISMSLRVSSIEADIWDSER